jgi:hypothetical protein
MFPFQRFQKKRNIHKVLIQNDCLYRTRDQILYKENVESRLYSFDLMLYQSQNKEDILQVLKTKINPQILLELTLQSTPSDAYDRLLNYISLYPFNEDALLLGYAGVIRWKQGKRFSVQAKLHLKKSLELTFHNYFLSTLFDVMIYTKEFKELYHILLKYPDDIVALRLLLSLFESTEYEFELQPTVLCRKILLIDPLFSMDYFRSVMKYLCPPDIVEFLVQRIEYDQADKESWRMLLHYLDKLKYIILTSEAQSELIWKSRLEWWPGYLDLSTNTAEKQALLHFFNAEKCQ